MRQNWLSRGGEIVTTDHRPFDPPTLIPFFICKARGGQAPSHTPTPPPGLTPFGGWEWLSMSTYSAWVLFVREAAICAWCPLLSAEGGVCVMTDVLGASSASTAGLRMAWAWKFAKVLPKGFGCAKVNLGELVVVRGALEGDGPLFCRCGHFSIHEYHRRKLNLMHQCDTHRHKLRGLPTAGGLSP